MFFPSASPAASSQNGGRVSLWAWAKEHPYTVAATFFFISQAFPALLRHHTEWNDVFVTASRNLMAGRDLAQGSAYLYPPFLALASIPFTLLPQALSQFIFYAINVACMIYVVKGAWSLSGGGRLQGAGEKVSSREHLVFLLALFCTGRFLVNALYQMQSDLLIAALLIAGCVALRAKKDFWAATSIGLAAAIKCTPVLFAPYLAWRGKWQAALWLVVIAVGVNFLPDLAYRSPSGGFWAADWCAHYIRPLTQESSVPGAWFAEISGNQSLSGAVNRFFTTSLKWTAEGVETVNRNDSFSPKTLRGITLLLYAIITVPAVYALRRRRRRDGPPGNDPFADALEFSIIFLLMLLLSPRSSRTHFGIMLLPALCVGRIAVSQNSHAAWSILLTATFASLISYSNPLNILCPVALWAGGVSLIAVLLLAGCIMGLLRIDEING
jgi:hypothetical protein